MRVSRRSLSGPCAILLLSTACTNPDPDATDAPAPPPPSGDTGTPPPPPPPVGPNVELTFVVDDGTLDAIGEATVTLDGEALPAIEADGTLSLEVTPGPHDLAVLLPGTWAGRETLEVPESGVLEQTVELSSGRLSRFLDYELVIDTAQPGQVVPQIADLAFSFRAPDGTLVSVEQAGGVRIAPIAEGSFVPGVGGEELWRAVVLDPEAIRLDEGTLVVTDPTSVFDALADYGETDFTVVVDGDDTDLGVTLEGVALLRIGTYDLTGSLTLPGGGTLEGRSIELLRTSGGVERDVLTHASGAFAFTDLPGGPYRVTVTIDDDPDQIRTAVGSVTLERDASPTVVLTPLTPAERAEGLVDEAVIDGVSRPPVPVEEPADWPWLRSPRLASGPDCEPPTAEQIVLSVGFLPETVTDVRTLEVATDSESVALEYEIVTQDVPEFMSRPGRPLQTVGFVNPTYTILVYEVATGETLFEVTRNLRDHRGGEDVLFEDGASYVWRTGEILERIPLPEDTAEVGLQVVLDSVSSLGTSVRAQLTTNPSLSLSWRGGTDDYRPSASVPFATTVLPVVRNGAPTLVARNLDPLRLPVDVLAAGATEPFEWDAVNLLEVRREPSDGSGDVELLRVEAMAASGEDPLRTVGTERVVVQADHREPHAASALADDGGLPAEFVEYVVSLEATLDECSLDDVERVRKRALYAGALDLEPFRSGNYDAGGDDWASVPTIRWLRDHRDLLGPEIGDISGEHGRDIGHQTHQYGSDIDFKQWGAVYVDAMGRPLAGTTMYERSRSDAVAALGGNAAALARLTTFVEAQREGLVALMADEGVERVYGPVGSEFGPLPEEWMRRLVTTGEARSTDGTQSIDLGLGNWAPPKPYITNAIHNNHFHVCIHQHRF